LGYHGFDTEYVTPDAPPAATIFEKVVRSTVSSRTIPLPPDVRRSLVRDHRSPDGERMSMGELIVFALGSRPVSPSESMLPRSIYLVGHYTKADLRHSATSIASRKSRQPFETRSFQLTRASILRLVRTEAI